MKMIKPQKKKHTQIINIESSRYIPPEPLPFVTRNQDTLVSVVLVIAVALIVFMLAVKLGE